MGTAPSSKGRNEDVLPPLGGKNGKNLPERKVHKGKKQKNTLVCSDKRGN